MTEPTFKGKKLYLGEEYKVKYISGNWVPDVKDYGTFIGELSDVSKLPENKQTKYTFVKIRNNEYAATMPEDQKIYFTENLPSKRTMLNWAIESMEPIEPDDVVLYKPRQNASDEPDDIVLYKPRKNMEKGGRSRTNKKKSRRNKVRSRKNKRKKFN